MQDDNQKRNEMAALLQFKLHSRPREAPKFWKGCARLGPPPSTNEKFRNAIPVQKQINMTCTCACRPDSSKQQLVQSLNWHGRCNHSQSFVLSLDPGFPLSQAMVMPMPSSMLGAQQQCCLNYGVNDMLYANKYLGQCQSDGAI